MGLLQNLLKVGGQAAGVAGAGLEGYAQDQTTQVARALSQAKLEQEAQRNAVLNRIGLAGIDPTIQKSLSAAKSGGEVEGGTPGLVARAGALAPVEAKAAALKAAALAPIAVKQQIDTAAGVEPIHTKGQIAVQAAKPDHFTPVVTTGEGGVQNLSSFDNDTGVTKDTGAHAKAPTGGGGGASAAIASRATAALPQIQEAATTLAKFNEPGALGRLLQGHALAGYFTTPEGQNALQAAEELARVHMGIPTGRAPGAPAIHDFAKSLLPQPGEENNPTVIKQKGRQVQQMAKQDSTLAGVGGKGASGVVSGVDPEFDALMTSLMPKKKP